ncbi:hypothetical protein F5X68DRAFT_197125 [Plectosphaerella plurivora]|uniref:Uncharacterized protein n=1 Tax=Plectosphaerella plurivora TaxID=936078 RepID=A0A9P8VNR8_9PEZI|nr:hypothetical protein F5X68DRAFT_197125 [Plectosphaerella plurivora]
MTLVSEFISTQFKAIEVFAAVLSPDSRTSPVEEEVDAFEQLEMTVIERIGSRLLQQSKHFQRMDKACDHLADEVRGLAEIMADQNSRAMMIFTIVTVFFLPPGFVAAYLSMGDGPDGLDFEGLQRRFWTIAGPLTVTVWAVCLFLAFGGAMNSPLDKARATVDEWRVRRAERQATKENGVDEEESPYVVEYGV